MSNQSAPHEERANSQLCLIAEADPFISKLLQRFAEESGLRTMWAQVGEQVLQWSRRDQPTVIVLDPELPGERRGWEVALALRATPETAGIQLIICSWLKEAAARKMVGGRSAYLQKPDLHYEDFVAALKGAGISVAPAESLNRTPKRDAKSA